MVRRPLAANTRALILIGLLALPLLVPAWLVWPWFQLVPLALYVILLPPAADEWRRGDWEWRSALGIGVVAGAVLIVWEHLTHTDVSNLRWLVPKAPILALAAGLGFALLNAGMEELIWRGTILFALQQRLGERAAVVAQALAFGLLHRAGVPRGLVGQLLASLFGLALGHARLRTKGLLTPFVAHVIADAVIYYILATQ